MHDEKKIIINRCGFSLNNDPLYYFPKIRIKRAKQRAQKLFHVTAKTTGTRAILSTMMPTLFFFQLFGRFTGISITGWNHILPSVCLRNDCAVQERPPRLHSTADRKKGSLFNSDRSRF